MTVQLRFINITQSIDCIYLKSSFISNFCKDRLEYVPKCLSHHSGHLQPLKIRSIQRFLLYSIKTIFALNFIHRFRSHKRDLCRDLIILFSWIPQDIDHTDFMSVHSVHCTIIHKLLFSIVLHDIYCIFRKYHKNRTLKS